MPDTQPPLLPRFWELPDGQYLMAAWTQPWPHPGVYDVRLPDSTQSYPAPGVYSLEEFLNLHDLYAVTGDRLCLFLWQKQWGKGTRTDQQSVLIDGLVLCPPTSLPFGPARIRPV